MPVPSQDRHMCGHVRRVWRYLRGNQKPYIEEEQTTQWPKEKVQKDKQLSTKLTHKTKDRVTRTPLISERVCICVVGVSNLFLSTIFLSEFGNVPKEWYFLFFSLLLHSRQYLCLWRRSLRVNDVVVYVNDTSYLKSSDKFSLSSSKLIKEVMC